MSEALFLRVLDPPAEAKGQELSRLVARLREGASGDAPDLTFVVNPADFSIVSESPFAYWVGEPIRRIFREFPRLESIADIQHGASSKDDFRYLRLWWEVDSACIALAASERRERKWVHFAKGGAYAAYYADIHLVINWWDDAAEIEADVLHKYAYLKGNAEWVLHRSNSYFRHGLTWPRRTTSRMSVRPLPSGCVFADKGPSLFLDEDDPALLLVILAIMESDLFEHMVSVMLAAVTAAARSYEVGIIQRIPIPHELPSADVWDVSSLIRLARVPGTRNEVTHDFSLPSVAEDLNSSLVRGSGRLEDHDRKREEELRSRASAIDSQVEKLYGLDGSATVSAASTSRGREEGDDEGSDEEPSTEDLSRRVANLLMWCVGVAFGRWDVRMAGDPSLIPELQGPFERLPRVAPGGLVGPDGLPATRSQIASEAWLRARPNVITLPEPGSWEGPDHITAAEYPIDVAWDGILVDDPGHPRDIVGKVREVLRYVYGPDRAQAIEDEALEILRADGRTPRSLRDWFRNQKATELGLSFFDFHIRRYSKSRRKAPIYWRLCTSPGRGQSGYGVWLYYHRLTDDTLWTVLNEYVGPRREREERRAEELRQQIEGAEGSEARELEKEREEAVALLEEIRWLEDEIRKVAEGGWAPDLDDGVVINLAPLRSVVPWNEPEKVWKKLQKGDYDWAKLAMRYWPDRVREKCRSDKSLAIAHGLEDLHETQA